MKKFLLTLALVATAGLLQAANIQWNIGANVIKGPDGANVAIGTSVYLFGGDISKVQEALADGTFNPAESTYAGATQVAATTTKNPVGFINEKHEVADSLWSETTPGEFYTIVVIKDADGNITDYQISSVKKALKPLDPNLPVSGAFTGAEITNNWQQPTDVPEPTAMALLLMGVAAVGLRRKARA